MGWDFWSVFGGSSVADNETNAALQEKVSDLRVLFCDDHAVVRLGLRYVLEHNFDCEVVECSDARQVVGLATAGGFDLVLLDVRLGDPDGLWALARIREEVPQLPVLMISTFADASAVQTAIDLGACGYLLKEATPSQLREAVDIARSGKGLYLHPAAAEAVRTPSRAMSGGPFSLLTPRELDVLRLVAIGRTNSEIGGELYLSEKTVKSRITSILRKLGLTNRTQAAALALREGLVSNSEDS